VTTANLVRHHSPEREWGEVARLGGLLAFARDRLAAAGADSPWLTTLILLEDATGLGRTTVLAQPDLMVDTGQVARFQAMVERRCRREPLAYIVGYREFFGRRFTVSPASLIPRPETESLVELALERVDTSAGSKAGGAHSAPTEDSFALLDVGTGSGAIVISILAERGRVRAVATDAAPQALHVAIVNARAHGVADRLKLIACDLASSVRQRFPLIVANLPYIRSADVSALEPEISSYEPRAALDGGADGTTVVRRFLAQLDGILAPGGAAILEMGEGQADTLRSPVHDLGPDYQSQVASDYTGADRFLVLERAAV